MPVTINGSNTPTAGGVTYGDGTQYATTSAGTSGQLLQSNGSSAPSWVAAPSSAMTLVSSATASSSSSIVFTNLNYSTYKQYIVLLSNVVPQNNGVSIALQMSNDNGATYKSGGFDYYYNYIRLMSAYNRSAGYAGEITITPGLLNDASRGGANLSVYLNSLVNSDYNAISFTGMVEDSSQSSIPVFGGGFTLGTAGPINAVKFIPLGGGTILSGTFKLYGIT